MRERGAEEKICKERESKRGVRRENIERRWENKGRIREKEGETEKGTEEDGVDRQGERE